jgi:hypothetical protein
VDKVLAGGKEEMPPILSNFFGRVDPDADAKPKRSTPPPETSAPFDTPEKGSAEYSFSKPVEIVEPKLRNLFALLTKSTQIAKSNSILAILNERWEAKT